MSVETLYRCANCKKWSHAKLKPKRHERFVLDGSDLLVPFRVVKETSGYIGRDEGTWVACGPFETWEAKNKEEEVYEG